MTKSFYQTVLAEYEKQERHYLCTSSPTFKKSWLQEGESIRVDAQKFLECNDKYGREFKIGQHFLFIIKNDDYPRNLYETIRRDFLEWAVINAAD